MAAELFYKNIAETLCTG